MTGLNAKLFSFLLFSLFTLHLHAQDSLYQKVIERSDVLVNKLNSSEISNEEKKELKNLAFGIQNHGMALEDVHGDYGHAEFYISKAIDLFLALKDTLNEANNRKFKSYLCGMLHRYSEGKEEGKRAISLYSSKKSWDGLAVAQYDLSKVFDQEKIFDSALFFCNKSLDHWTTTTNYFRILSVKTLKIYLLARAGKIKEAITVQTEAERLIDKKDLSERDKADFYLVSSRLFRKAGEKELDAGYDKLYRDMLQAYTDKGKTYSTYFIAL